MYVCMYLCTYVYVCASIPLRCVYVCIAQEESDVSTCDGESVVVLLTTRTAKFLNLRLGTQFSIHSPWCVCVCVAYDNSRTQDKIRSKLTTVQPKSPISGQMLMYFSSLF